jgi:hypothetical protein
MHLGSAPTDRFFKRKSSDVLSCVPVSSGTAKRVVSPSKPLGTSNLNAVKLLPKEERIKIDLQASRKPHGLNVRRAATIIPGLCRDILTVLLVS